MLRSRSSGLLPITHSASLSHHMHHESRSRLSFRRKAGISPAAQRLVAYLLVVLLLAGSIYAVAKMARAGKAAGPDDLGLADGRFVDTLTGAASSGSGAGRGASTSLLRQARSGGAAGRAGAALDRAQHDHSIHGLHDVHDMLHDDVHDRRAAMEEQQQRHGAEEMAAAGLLDFEAQQLEQIEQLEQQHMQQGWNQHSGDLDAWTDTGAHEQPETAQREAAQREAAQQAQHMHDLHLIEQQHLQDLQQQEL